MAMWKFGRRSTTSSSSNNRRHQREPPLSSYSQRRTSAPDPESYSQRRAPDSEPSSSTNMRFRNIRHRHSSSSSRRHSDGNETNGSRNYSSSRLVGSRQQHNHDSKRRPSDSAELTRWTSHGSHSTADLTRNSSSRHSSSSFNNSYSDIIGNTSVERDTNKNNAAAPLPPKSVSSRSSSSRSSGERANKNATPSSSSSRSPHAEQKANSTHQVVVNNSTNHQDRANNNHQPVNNNNNNKPSNPKVETEIVVGKKYTHSLHGRGYYTGEIDISNSTPHGMGTWRSESTSSPIFLEGQWNDGNLNSDPEGGTLKESQRVAMTLAEKISQEEEDLPSIQVYHDKFDDVSCLTFRSNMSKMMAQQRIDDAIRTLGNNVVGGGGGVRAGERSEGDPLVEEKFGRSSSPSSGRANDNFSKSQLQHQYNMRRQQSQNRRGRRHRTSGLPSIRERSQSSSRYYES